GKDRNVCAHPSFQPDTEDLVEISPEQVRAYARLVADSVLSQPPVAGKALVDRFTEDAKSESWPEDNVVEFVRSRYFDRARRPVIRNILSVAVKGAIRPPAGENSAAGRCVATILAALQIDEKLMISEVADTLSKWRDQLSGDDLLRLLGAVGTMEAAWTTIGVDNVARVKTLLTTKSASQ